MNYVIISCKVSNITTFEHLYNESPDHDCIATLFQQALRPNTVESFGDIGADRRAGNLIRGTLNPAGQARGEHYLFVGLGGEKC